MGNPFKKEESTAAHNARQLLGCAPVLGSLAVGVLGLVAFGIGVNHLGDRQPGWLIGGGIGLVGSGIGFGVLAWLVWADRRDEGPGPLDRGDRVTPASSTSKLCKPESVAGGRGALTGGWEWYVIVAVEAGSRPVSPTGAS